MWVCCVLDVRIDAWWLYMCNYFLKDWSRLIETNPRRSCHWYLSRNATIIWHGDRWVHWPLLRFLHYNRYLYTIYPELGLCRQTFQSSLLGCSSLDKAFFKHGTQACARVIFSPGIWYNCDQTLSAISIVHNFQNYWKHSLIRYWFRK